MIEVVDTELNDLKIISPKIFEDDRGYFFESWNQKDFLNNLIDSNFVQDNESLSTKGTLRGMHIQIANSQGKLVRVVEGSVFDAVVDCRRNSSTFGKSFGIELSSLNKKQIWIPEGFAHGFLVLSEYAIFNYKCTQYYDPKSEETIIWNDGEIDIQWPISDQNSIILSDKDKKGISFSEFKTFI